MTSSSTTESGVIPAAQPWTRPDRAPAHRRELAPVEDRGTLTVDAGVVEKIAATAAVEIDEVGGAAKRVLTVSLGSDAHADHPQVDAEVDGPSATLAVRCSIAYPAPVVAVSDRLRAHLVARIDELTGLRARRIDITVAALTSDNPANASGRELL